MSSHYFPDYDLMDCIFSLQLMVMLVEALPVMDFLYTQPMLLVEVLLNLDLAYMVLLGNIFNLI